MKTLRQLIADYIVSNPDCRMVEILTNGGSGLVSDGKTMCKTLKAMVDAGELSRKGTLKNYTYSAGPSIMRAVDGVRAAPKKPVSGRKGIKNSNVMQIRQLWVRVGEYTIANGDTRFNSLWSYADSFRDGLLTSS